MLRPPDVSEALTGRSASPSGQDRPRCTTSATTSTRTAWWCVMPYAVDFNTVSTVGLESSPVAAALAGLRANEARYFKK